MHTSNRISFEQEMPNWVTRSTTMIRKEGLYLRWRRSQASEAMVGRCSGEATWCRQTGTATRTPTRLRRALLYKNGTKYCHLKKFGRTSPARGGFKNLQNNNGSMADIQIQRLEGRKPHKTTASTNTTTSHTARIEKKGWANLLCARRR